MSTVSKLSRVSRMPASNHSPTSMINISVKNGTESESILLSPRVRANCEIFAKLINGTQFHDADAAAMKTIVKHLDGDDDFKDILDKNIFAKQNFNKLCLDVVSVWILAGQLRLPNVQNRLLKQVFHCYGYAQYAGAWTGSIESDLFDYIREKFGRGVETKIERFMTHMIAGLSKYVVVRKSRELRVEKLNEIRHIIAMNEATGTDGMPVAMLQCLVFSDGSSVPGGGDAKAHDLTVEIPTGMAPAMIQAPNYPMIEAPNPSGHEPGYAETIVSQKSGVSHQSSKSHRSHASNATGVSGRTSLSEQNVEAMNLMNASKAPSAIPPHMRSQMGGGSQSRQAQPQEDTKSHHSGRSHRTNGQSGKSTVSQASQASQATTVIKIGELDNRPQMAPTSHVNFDARTVLPGESASTVSASTVKGSKSGSKSGASRVSKAESSKTTASKAGSVIMKL
ncbi:hypothetical protein BDV95DRAFT_594503 [Massariosphaeria phaeospora]|uniref:BTB domain-containing protein n=1 Tax=Massariosphaeria phaeospora TaxID=100035 RepID=A0A7C8I7N6_9PLEO|nr:hypothetical protein BDV95DRAFT_594503 [Massariosphaeria phaeospora]